jgi:WD40 repeat protein/ABC-type dipeptide/oligopeptide/nickel transport system ATPase subunit
MSNYERGNMGERKTGRRRGAILTTAGYQRLQAARRERECTLNFGDRYTREQLSSLTGLSIKTIAKIFDLTIDLALERSISVDKQTLDLCFTAFDLVLERGEYFHPQPGTADLARYDCFEAAIAVPDRSLRIDWGEAPDISVFYGRTTELTTLATWIDDDRCKLVGILGMGGIGKTALVTKLTYQLQPNFTKIVWRSLRNAPPLATLIPELIQILSDRTQILDPSVEISTQISQLLDYLRQQRCLLVLDNAEAIINRNTTDMLPLEDPAYAELFWRIGGSVHQSCLVLTSREKPAALIPLEGDRLPVRTLTIAGLNSLESEHLFDAKGLSITADRQRLWQIYSGNPLALNIVATAIQDLFDGDIDRFLAAEVSIFSDIRQLLDRQFDRLSPAEQQVMYWLAIERDWVSLAELHPQIVPATTKPRLLATLELLSRKSLIEHSRGKCTQQAVVMEYMTARSIDRVSCELIDWDIHAKRALILPLWLSHPLMEAQSPAYIQAIQTRLILEPISSQLRLHFGQTVGIAQHIRSICRSLQTHYQGVLHYGGGNLLNLCRHLHIDLTGWDFGGLPIWQADLQGANLHAVNFRNADLSTALFTKNFGGIFALAFSPDAKLVVMGDYSGDLLIWQVETKQLQAKLKGYSNWIWAIAFSPDGQVLASASQDAAVRLWDVQTGALFHLLQADHHVLSIGYSPDGQTLATAHGDGTIRFWDVITGTQRGQLAAHTKEACSVRYSPDGRLLATSSNDRAVKIWEVSTGKCLQTLTAHTQRIWVVRFSPDGRLLATGSGDGTVKLWDVATWTVVQVLTGYRNWLFSICFSPDSRLLLTGIDDTVRIWDIAAQRQIGTLCGHTSWISSIQFSADGKLLVTSSGDRTVRLWNPLTWQELYRWEGYTNWVESVVFHPDGTKLVSGGQDAIVRVWDVETGQVYQTFAGHDLGIWSVAYSPAGRSTVIASSSADSTVKLWDTETGRSIRAFSALQGDIWSVQFSPDGRLLAAVGMDNAGIYLWSVVGELVATLFCPNNLIRSLAFSPDSKLLAAAGFDSCWRLWDVATGELLGCHAGHTNWIWDLAFSPDGRSLATCSDDRTTKLWDVETGELLHTFTGHTLEVVAVKFSPDGRYLATSGGDRQILIWELATQTVSQTFTGHLDRILSLSYSPDGKLLASGSADETIKLWDLTEGKCLRTCKTLPPYAGMDITHVTGLTPATIGSLKMLGAIAD